MTELCNKESNHGWTCTRPLQHPGGHGRVDDPDCLCAPLDTPNEERCNVYLPGRCSRYRLHDGPCISCTTVLRDGTRTHRLFELHHSHHDGEHWVSIKDWTNTAYAARVSVGQEMLVVQNMNTPRLHVGDRGSGKTRRLVDAILRLHAQSPHCRATVVGPATPIIQQLEECGYKERSPRRLYKGDSEVLFNTTLKSITNTEHVFIDELHLMDHDYDIFDLPPEIMLATYDTSEFRDVVLTNLRKNPEWAERYHFPVHHPKHPPE